MERSNESIKPVRLQLSRKAGFNLQRLSQETNGLPAVSVARGSGRWGNPFPVGAYGPMNRKAIDAAGATGFFRAMLSDPCMLKETGYPAGDIVKELSGKNLACWCPPHSHCHADVLLKVASGEIPQFKR